MSPPYRTPPPRDPAAAMVLRYYLVYVVLDASLSMRRDLTTGRVEQNGDPQNTSLGRFIRLISPMLRELADKPIVNSLASISVIAFNDTPQVLREMATLDRPGVIAAPNEGVTTDYVKVLRFIADQHRRDVHSVRAARHRPDAVVTTARPWIFFITDGLPYTKHGPQAEVEWMPHRETLISDDIGARIVTIGLHNADGRVLWELATGTDGSVRNALLARANTDPASLATSIVNAIKNSIARSLSSGSAGTLLIEVPAGMRRVNGRSRG